MRIIFVCTGNICRSVMAEAFVGELLTLVDKSIIVDISSAGLEAQEGELPPHDVVEVMKDYGLDVAAHRAHSLQAVDVEEADLILTMAMHNSSRMLTAHQEAVEKIFTLKEFVFQGRNRGRDLAESDVEKRLQDLKGWIRRHEGWELPRGETDLNGHLRLFFLHYFHIYDHRFTIDDPLGQSMEFMRRTAEEIRESVQLLMGSELLAVL